MNLLSRYAGMILRTSFLITSFISFATFKFTPASAQTLVTIPNIPNLPTFTVQQGGFSGVITYITPSAYITSIAAQKVSPEGTYLAGIDGKGTYIVTGSIYIDPITHISTPTIALLAGPTLPIPSGDENVILSTVADRLRYGNLTLDEYTAILRAATPGLL
ncbi:hypothetical protein VF14_25200 [Nostoc linckia z18]|jgi:hypothetical protein|uniref:Uncharacterized protein n=2 Tax=Nostoc linckia TaxID=92942 RepID=A0A9Q5ZG68_NOSLI|nr:hypothetical protein [Nostoc linckia]MBL1200748.1 hypothetical protein [Nostoc sp. GBBB01]PHK39897.1 hypothetical protein VF12_12590 [Nostoc linckia z15]PHK43782.1 hypothetical protein VF13_25420 [Nostoc linckia z16]PHJ58815.1 hypothetical protein VF02_26625 [Nostoc linckia z1]PHJ61484.1 hypothetical protein VF05_28575 [Nostoc linckia z3]